MKLTILLLAFSVAVFSSCTTAYKTGQTPDDVYYSPTRPVQENEDEYAQVDKYDDRQYRNDDDYYDDRFLRLKIHNRYRWNEMNDWYYNDYRFSKYYGYNHNYWGYYNYWNNYYNPYYPHYVVVNPKNVFTYNKPRTFNLNTYTPAQQNSKTGNAKTGIWGSNNSSGTSNGSNTEPRKSTTKDRNSGKVLRDIFNSGNSGSSGSNSSSSSGSSSSSSSSSGSNSSSSGSSKASTRKF